ncbi:MAG: c-type cytochrome [Bryobacteraceae bacterium]
MRCVTLLLSTLALDLLADDNAIGKRLFDAHCAPCHGIGGAGGSGPALSKLRRAPTPDALLAVIRDGLPGTAMPRGWMFSERELGQVAGYVRGIGTVAPEPVPGDAVRGTAVFASRGCGGCHIVRGKGDAFGPELTEIGAQRSPRHLRESLLKPAASFPDGFLMVRAVAGGRTVEGIRITEDTFTIQILDRTRRIHSFRKAALAKLERLAGQSPMPGYADLPTEELQNLVAYLVSLRGGQ